MSITTTAAPGPVIPSRYTGLGKPIDWILRVVKGMVIALGFILPGVSGGVLAAIMGLYEPLLRFIAHIRHNFWKNFLFFVPVGIGGIIGLVVLSRPLEFLLERWPVIVLWGFAGAILGTLPALFRESTREGPRDRTDLAWLIGTAILGGIGLYLLPLIGLSLPNNFLGFFIAGVLIALGVLVPGLSPSNLLLILGIFSAMLAGFSERNIVGVFLPIILGAITAMALFSKLMESLLDRYPSRVYHFIIGLVIASTILIVVPTASEEAISYAGVTGQTIAIAAFTALVGLALGLWMSKLEDKYKTVDLDATEDGVSDNSPVPPGVREGL